MNTKYLYTTRGFVLPQMEEPKVKDFPATSPHDIDNYSKYYAASVNWKNHLSSLPAIPVQGTHSFEVGKFYELGKDFQLRKGYIQSDDAPDQEYWTAIPLPPQPTQDSAGERDPFIQKHLDIIWGKTKEAQIDRFIKPMFGSLSASSIKHFIETGSVNGSFLQALNQMMDALKNWGRPITTGSTVCIPSADHIRMVKEFNEMKQLVKDYEEVDEDHKRLVRELDVILNGANAAKQPSLCDIVAQILSAKNTIIELIENKK